MRRRERADNTRSVHWSELIAPRRLQPAHNSDAASSPIPRSARRHTAKTTIDDESHIDDEISPE